MTEDEHRAYLIAYKRQHAEFDKDTDSREGYGAAAREGQETQE